MRPNMVPHYILHARSSIYQIIPICFKNTLLPHVTVLFRQHAGQKHGKRKQNRKRKKPKNYPRSEHLLLAAVHRFHLTVFCQGIWHEWDTVKRLSTNINWNWNTETEYETLISARFRAYKDNISLFYFKSVF